ncbi:MAG: DUF2085 domain-containing protein [Polyangiaceae bacterium]|nr:DUF2085 domain-containing protein [Polyangiaceae bacterium]
MARSLDRLAGPRLAVAVRAVLVLLGLSPIVLPFAAQVPGLRYLGWPLETWFAWQCHREVGRTFELFGQAMPVCSRCFGIYLGLGLGALVLRPRLDVWPLRIWVAFGAVAMILDVATEGLAMRPPSGWVRFATGLVLAYPVGTALVLAARGDDPPPATAPEG